MLLGAPYDASTVYDDVDPLAPINQSPDPDSVCYVQLTPRNVDAGRELIPQSIIDRAPSAELRADQLDEDSLPPYPQLDQVLEAYVEDDRTLEELSTDGFDRSVVERAVALVDRAEYKRRQAPPGVRLRPKAFGRDRRTPITNRWRS